MMEQITDVTDKMIDLWQSWDEKQQIYAALSAVGLLIILLVLLLYVPLKTHNSSLKNQWQVQNDVAKQLQFAQTTPLVSTAAEPTRVKSVVSKVAKRFGLNIKLKSKDEQWTLQAKAQNFNVLSNFLSSLRDKYAIVATQAVITKVKDGIVDADLTLSLP